MSLGESLDQYVVDAIAFDAEQLDSIVEYLNDPDSEWSVRFERKVQRPEVLMSLMRLVRNGLVEVQVLDSASNDFIEFGEGVWPPNPVASMYCDLTGRGRVRYLNWDY
jgi:hypothetical protein